VDEVIRQLKEISSKIDTIIGVMKRPEYGGAGVSIPGILSIIDIIRTWIFGG
jgi:hypothetical protein